MLTDPPIEKLLPNTECAYELVALVSKRARQLVDGAQPMIPESAANMVSLACKEVAEGKVVSVAGDKTREVFIPKTREAREATAAALKAKEEEEYYKRISQQFESEKEAEESNFVDSFKSEDEAVIDEGDVVDEPSDEIFEDESIIVEEEDVITKNEGEEE